MSNIFKKAGLKWTCLSHQQYFITAPVCRKTPGWVFPQTQRRGQSSWVCDSRQRWGVFACRPLGGVISNLSLRPAGQCAQNRSLGKERTSAAAREVQTPLDGNKSSAAHKREARNLVSLVGRSFHLGGSRKHWWLLVCLNQYFLNDLNSEVAELEKAPQLEYSPASGSPQLT